MKPENAAIVDDLRANPDKLTWSYGDLAQHYQIGLENVARLIRTAGLEKVNAHGIQKEARKTALLSDPERPSLRLRELAAKHGLSRITAFRYLAEAGLSCKGMRDKNKVKVAVLPKPKLAKPVKEPKAPRKRRTSQEAEVPSRQAPITPANGKCHQRVIREDTVADDLARLTPILGDVSLIKASDFVIGIEPFSPEHREFIKRYEWLGNSGSGIKWTFAARYAGHLGGVVLMAEPYHPSVDTALIARGACAGWTPKNLASRLIMWACRWMAQNTEKRKFIAYSDQEAGEYGTVYQAANFRFLGFKTKRYGVDANGKRRSYQALKRTAYMVPWLKKVHGIELPPECFTDKGYLHWSAIPVDIKKMMRDHAKERGAKFTERFLLRGSYMLAIGRNKGETRKLMASLPPAQAYPKRANAT